MGERSVAALERELECPVPIIELQVSNSRRKTECPLQTGGMEPVPFEQEALPVPQFANSVLSESVPHVLVIEPPPRQTVDTTMSVSPA
jgi:hypothetical protein